MSNTYSFLDVNAAIVGPGAAISLGSGAGIADEGITIEPAGEINTMVIGADGEGAHSLHADKSGHITVRLLKTSPINAQLSAMMAYQRTSAANHGQNTITVTNNAMGEVATCQHVAFSKVPVMTWAKDAGFNEWRFDAIKIDIAFAG